MSFFMNWSLFSYAGLVWNRKFSNIYSSLSLYVYNCLYVHPRLLLCTQSFFHEYTSFFTWKQVSFYMQVCFEIKKIINIYLSPFLCIYKCLYVHRQLFLSTQSLFPWIYVIFHEFKSLFMYTKLFPCICVFFINWSLFSYAGLFWNKKISQYLFESLLMHISASVRTSTSLFKYTKLFPWI